MSVLPYILAIGINDPRVGDVEPLHHADDDAAAFVELFGAHWERARLLTDFDRETRELFPGYAEEARPPTRRELLRAVSELVSAIDRDHDEKPIVLISIGGHAASNAGRAELLLLDGPMSQDALVDEVIAPLAHAHRVHLIIDTCFAAALVRTRAKVEGEDADRVRQSFLSTSIARFGNVGALLGSAPNRRSFEWEEIGAGVSSAIVRSGLRGGADVDDDHRISYRELASFAAAASRAIPVARARPELIAVPPPVDPDASLIDLDWLAPSYVLAADLARMGRFFVWDARGRWIAGGRFERDFAPRLLLPREELYLDTGGVITQLAPTSTGTLTVGLPSAADVRDRSMLASALQSGLFAEAYGPAFHRGFVASSPIAESRDFESPNPDWMPLVLYATAGAAGLAAIVAGSVAAEAGIRAANTDIEREATVANDRYRAAGITAIVSLSLSATLTVIGLIVD